MTLCSDWFAAPLPGLPGPEPGIQRHGPARPQEFIKHFLHAVFEFQKICVNFGEIKAEYEGAHGLVATPLA